MGAGAYGKAPTVVYSAAFKAYFLWLTRLTAETPQRLGLRVQIAVIDILIFIYLIAFTCLI